MDKILKNVILSEQKEVSFWRRRPVLELWHEFQEEQLFSKWQFRDTLLTSDVSELVVVEDTTKSAKYISVLIGRPYDIFNWCAWQ